jgi:hypothetical protein
VGDNLQVPAPKVMIADRVERAQGSHQALFDPDEVASIEASVTRNEEHEPISHDPWTANDIAVQRRAREGAQQPTRPSDCNGRLDRAEDESLPRHAYNDSVRTMDLYHAGAVGS